MASMIGGSCWITDGIGSEVVTMESNEFLCRAPLYATIRCQPYAKRCSMKLPTRWLVPVMAMDLGGNSKRGRWVSLHKRAVALQPCRSLVGVWCVRSVGRLWHGDIVGA